MANLSAKEEGRTAASRTGGKLDNVLLQFLDEFLRIIRA